MEVESSTPKKAKKGKHIIKFDDDKIKNISITVQTFRNDQFMSLELPQNKDIIPGKYEGGIKLWECALDLCNFLPGYIGWYDMTNLKVLELGCGHGIPGIYFLLRNTIVMFQDFNVDVLNKVTKSYIEQLVENYSIDLIGNCAFMPGDWSTFSEKLQSGEFECSNTTTKEILSSSKFDIIISADTLYNPSNYEVLYETIKSNLNKPGICFISSKKFYFGVGGGTSEFVELVKKKGELEIKVVKEINNGISNIRQILEIRNM